MALTDDDAFDLAIYVGLVFGDEDRELFAPLVDAKLVWLASEQCAPIADAIVDSLWDDEFRADLERALDAGAAQIPSLGGRVAAARADLRRFARAVVEQAADQFAGDEQKPVFCLCCVEEGIAHATGEERRRRARSVARIVTRTLGVPPAELRAAVASGRAAEMLATDERRLAVRNRLRSLAELGAESMPVLSAALLEVVGGPLPEPSHDDVWPEAVVGLVGSLGSEWN